MPETAYTVHDTPETVDRIETDLSTAVSTVREADPHLRSFVLTGGFARGEGALLDGQPQNDYDFVAVRSIGRARRPYSELAAELEDELGLHIDLATIHPWRLPWVDRSIFWYETALRGRVLWGEDVLDRVPVRRPEDVAPAEGLRLLVNRAAGLLLATRGDDDHAHRVQAAKALLAALDAHLLALGEFPPSQTERWQRFEQLSDRGQAPPVLDQLEPWLSWAVGYKTDPGSADEHDAEQAWRAAARAIWASVPVARRNAGLSSLDDYRGRDGLVDHLHYLVRSSSVPQARRLVANPTGTVRVATLRTLGDAVEGTDPGQAAREHLAPIAEVNGRPFETLEALRDATLQ